jgi:ATP-binding cassette subfamily C (CFTR/MRP) protein 1
MVTMKLSMSDVVAMASFFCDLAPQLGCWLAARQMHIVMLRAVMRAPLTFFDTTPIGRIISRFAKDVDVLDTSLPPQISDTIYCLFEVIFFCNV